MMGVQAASAQPFYDFCLDDHVPSDHLLRGIDGHLDFGDLRQTLKPFYSWIGGRRWICGRRQASSPPILFHRLSQLGLPMVCVESRQAYQALKSLATTTPIAMTREGWRIWLAPGSSTKRASALTH
jgi:hypothetical protein